MQTSNTTFIYRFLTANPDNIPERLRLARLLAHNGLVDDALAHYHIARALLEATLIQQPPTPALYEQLAEAQAALGDETGAQSAAHMAGYLKQLQHIS
jgi:predicted Zn-dependent protease